MLKRPAEPGSTRISPGRGGVPVPAVPPLSPHGRRSVSSPPFWLTGALLVLFLASCVPNPKPQPPPSPCPESPYPWCHETIPQMTCGDCVHQPLGEKCPVLAPECPVEPPEPPPPTCRPKAQARVYWFGHRTADATPALCGCDNCKQWEAQDGTQCYLTRYCCPVGCEDDPNRGQAEAELMGGELPVWELVVDSGNLRRANPGEWKYIVKGHGKGRLRWHFKNGRATSKWLEIDRPKPVSRSFWRDLELTLRASYRMGLLR